MSKTDKRPPASQPGLLHTDPRTVPAARCIAILRRSFFLTISLPSSGS